jgi:uroporphyrinogen-III decarboxylase
MTSARATMSGRERFAAVFRGELPDRVPVTLFIQDQGHFLEQLCPDVDPWDSLTLQLRTIEFQRELGVDILARLLFGTLEPFWWMLFGGVDVSRSTDDWQVETTERREGRTTVRASTIRTPGGILAQEFSIDAIRPGTLMYACTRKPVRTREDLELVAAYEPGMPADLPARVAARVAPIREAVGDDGWVGIWAPHGPYNMASLLMDEQELYALFLEDPEYHARLMEVSLARVHDYVRAVDAPGVDVLFVGGNVPGGFLGRHNYEAHILPWEARHIAWAQANGTPAVYHNCGQIAALVESYTGLGVAAVEPFSPPPKLGDADLAEAKRLVGDAYVIIGGVDQVDVIQKGSVEEVRRATARTMRAGKPGGRFIIQNADFLEYGTPIENVRAFVRTAIDGAWYRDED